MQVRDVMNDSVHHISGSATLREASEQMSKHGIGFLGIRNGDDSRLQGVITDRDIVIRGIAAGMDPATTAVQEAKSDPVLYCFQNDDLKTASNSMRDQQVYRLIVLDDRDSKQLAGVVTLGDIVRHDQEGLAGDAARDILGKAA